MSEGGPDPGREPGRERPVVTVLHEGARPGGVGEVERDAEVRFVTEAGLADGLRGADVLYLAHFASTALGGAWPAADRLRWIHTASAGVDRLLLPEVLASDVALTNSRGVFERSISEYVLGLLLAHVKDLAGTLDRQRRSVWEHRETRMLAGLRAVVVGVGPIGREAARLLRAVGVSVRGVGRTARTGDPDLGDVAGTPDLPAVLADADVVVAVAPLTPATRGMFDARLFTAMPRHAYFVNVGRGELVVEADLVAALRAHRLGGAALDVFATEPLPASSPLWGMPGVVVSPHMSADFVGWRSALDAVFVAQYRRWRAGEPLRHQVDKQLGYVPA